MRLHIRTRTGIYPCRAVSRRVASRRACVRVLVMVVVGGDVVRYALLIQKNFRRKHAMLYLAEVKRQAKKLDKALASRDIPTLEAALAEFDAKCGNRPGRSEAAPVFRARSKLKHLKLEATLLPKLDAFMRASREHRIAEVYEQIIEQLDQVDELRAADKQAFRGPKWDILEDLRREARVFEHRKELQKLRSALDVAARPINDLLAGAGAAAEQELDFEAVKAECDKLYAAAKLIEEFALGDAGKPDPCVRVWVLACLHASCACVRAFVVVLCVLWVPRGHFCSVLVFRWLFCPRAWVVACWVHARHQVSCGGDASRDERSRTVHHVRATHQARAGTAEGHGGAAGGNRSPGEADQSGRPVRLPIR